MLTQKKSQIVCQLAESALFDLSILGLLILSPAGIILLANKAARKLFIDTDQPEDKTLTELFFTDPDFDVAIVRKTILNEGSDFIIKLPITNPPKTH